MKVETLTNACPVCSGDVKGSERYKFYCKHCNMLFERGHLKKADEPKKTGQPIPLVIIQKEKIVLRYVVSHQSNRYHSQGCRYIRQINKENLSFFDTAREAEKQGYFPCVCARKK